MAARLLTKNTIPVILTSLSRTAIGNPARPSMAFAALAHDRYSNPWYYGNASMNMAANAILFRSCTTNASNTDPSMSNRLPSPSNGNMDSKEKVEKFFFRIVAFCWDNGGSLIGWSRDMFKTLVLDTPSVQFYWKRFHEKMAEAKKNDI